MRSINISAMADSISPNYTPCTDRRPCRRPEHSHPEKYHTVFTPPRGSAPYHEPSLSEPNAPRQGHHHVVVPRQSSLGAQTQIGSYKKRPAARIRVVHGDLICVVVDNFCFCMCAVHEYIFYSSTTTIVSHQFSYVNDPG